VKLLDTMVIVYARTPSSRFHAWAVEQISQAVVGDGAALNAASLAELCAEDGVEASAVVGAVNAFGVHVLDVPAAAAERCGEAYRNYRRKRKAESQKDAPRMPLPDFFIGAQAELMNWELVTNDPQRIRNYFPTVRLITP
jgi:predicted nucleic acid-binding protein